MLGGFEVNISETVDDFLDVIDGLFEGTEFERSILEQVDDPEFGLWDLKP